MTARLGLVAAALVNVASASAEPPGVILADQLSASPDAPVFGIVWRRAPHVTLAAAIPIAEVASEAPFGLRLTPFVEVHNNSGSTTPIPNENWRGRISLEGWRVWSVGTKSEERRWLRLGVGYEHESDHSSVRIDAPPRESAFRGLNDLTVRVTLNTPVVGELVAIGRLDSRLYFISCTRPGVDCLNAPGAFGYGGALELTWQLSLRADWHAFWSVSFSWIVPNGQLAKSLRLVSHLGLWKRGRGGLWQAFFLGYNGNEVGILSDTSVRQLGLGLRWVP